MPPAHPPTPTASRSPWRLLTALLCLILSGLLGLPQAAPPAAAQPSFTAEQRGVLDQVRALTGSPANLQVVRLPGGAYFADLRGVRQPVLLAKTDAQGRLQTRCVGTLEEAEAFLAGSEPALAEAVDQDGGLDTVQQIVEGSPQLRRAALAAASQTVITIAVADGPGEGFNDLTPAAPVGGNSGTTVGQQRLKAFQYAAGIWAAYLQSTVPIVIEARFDPLTCDSFSGVLGSAGPTSVFSDFTPSGAAAGPEHPDTWYVSALANKRAGRDLAILAGDISARFNSGAGSAGCLTNSPWYYGLDNNAPGSSIDLLPVLLHEFGHGLGFYSLVGTSPGSYGQNFDGKDDSWNYVLYDNSIGKLFKDMTDGERALAITRTGALVWDGPAVQQAARTYLRATPALTITAPPAVAGQYAVSSAPFGAPLPYPPRAGGLSAAVDADEDGAAGEFSARDACSALTNSAAVAGTIALIDRGGCDFTVKVKNAQDAGAIAAVIINNAPGGPPGLSGSDASITITTVGVAQETGAALRAALASEPVAAQVGQDRDRLAGSDGAARVKMYAPATISAGSSVAHFDTSASPNLLMEPFINADLGQGLDLTDDLLRDIGWYADANYDGAPDVAADLRLTLTVTPTRSLGVGSALTATLTVANPGPIDASAASLAGSFSPQLGSVAWTAVYRGGASGPASGSGALNVQLNLPAGGAATFTISARVRSEAAPAVFSAEVGLADGADARPADNRALVSVYGAANTVFIPFVAR